VSSSSGRAWLGCMFACLPCLPASPASLTPRLSLLVCLLESEACRVRLWVMQGVTDHRCGQTASMNESQRAHERHVCAASRVITS